MHSTYGNSYVREKLIVWIELGILNSWVNTAWPNKTIGTLCGSGKQAKPYLPFYFVCAPNSMNRMNLHTVSFLGAFLRRYQSVKIYRWFAVYWSPVVFCCNEIEWVDTGEKRKRKTFNYILIAQRVAIESFDRVTVSLQLLHFLCEFSILDQIVTDVVVKEICILVLQRQTNFVDEFPQMNGFGEFQQNWNMLKGNINNSKETI